MAHYSPLHGITFALVLALKLGLWNCQEPAELFAPQNLEIHSDAAQKRLILEWNIRDPSSAPDVEIKFHIQVARSKNLNVILNECYITNISRLGKPFRWTWDSQLPLECDSHSLRIRSAVVGGNITLGKSWSTWSPWKTHYGQNTENRKNTVIYPHEKVVFQGSDVTFCCLPEQRRKVQKMRYRNKVISSQSHSMGTESYVITVTNVTITASDGGNVICEMDNDKNSGTVLIVTKPIEEPKNFSCKTQDMQFLNCSWNPGPRYNFYRLLTVKYELHEWFSRKSSSCSRSDCSWPIVGSQQIYNFTLTASNMMGERRIHAIVTLTESVLPVDPSHLAARPVNGSHVVLNWLLRANYTSLVILCQIAFHDSLVNTTSKGRASSEMYSVSLTGLQPGATYDLKVRCMSVSSLAGWSNWSKVHSTRTPEDVPTGALDIWRHIEDYEGGRVVTLYWRPSPSFSANGIISHYNIKWWQLEGAPVINTTRVSAQQNSSRIYIGRRAYSISVTAENGAGISPAAEIRISRARENDSGTMFAQRTSGKDGGIYVKWEQCPTVHGYVVEWCNVPKSPYCDLQWKKYNSSVHSDVIKSSVFRPGVRYDFRIYGSKEDGEHLLEKRTGYMLELVSSVTPKVKFGKIEANSLTLDWGPYPTDDSQEGFVTGYNIYLKNTEGACKLDLSDDHIHFVPSLDGSHVCSFYNGEPEKTQMTINGLKSNTQYEVAVVAVTGGGETTLNFIKANTLSDTGEVILPIVLPVIIVALVALALLFVGCWKRDWLKDKCYPDIPDPNKSKILSFSTSKGAAGKYSIPGTIGWVPQEVEVVRIQENVDHKICGEINYTSDNELGLIYATIQKNHNTTPEVNSNYFTKEKQNAHPLTQTDGALPLPQPMSITYLEFFNQNYTSSHDDLFDCLVSPGYRPQTDSDPHVVDTEHVSRAFNHIEPTDEEERFDELDVCFGSVATFNAEPRSPTSTNSTTFILSE